MNPPLTHGCIMGGIVTTPSLDLALDDYQRILGLRLVERGSVPDELAVSWGCSGSAGAPMATLQPTSGAHCFIRLVEQPMPPDFVPTTSFGWAAYELTVQDVFTWPDKLADSGFDIIGPPKDIPSLPYFVAMQVHGRGKEMLYFNETRSNTPSNDLPFAQSPIDHIFIAILAAHDREASVAWYRDRIGLEIGDTYTIAYSMINKAFALPADTLSALTMVQKGRMPIVEVDDYPAQASVRPRNADCLPPGNALVTLGVASLDTVNVDFIAPPTVRSDAIYGNRRTATICGVAGELLELIEIGGN